MKIVLFAISFVISMSVMAGEMKCKAVDADGNKAKYVVPSVELEDEMDILEVTDVQPLDFQGKSLKVFAAKALDDECLEEQPRCRKVIKVQLSDGPVMMAFANRAKKLGVISEDGFKFNCK